MEDLESTLSVYQRFVSVSQWSCDVDVACGLIACSDKIRCSTLSVHLTL